MLLKIVHYFITKNIHFTYITDLLDMESVQQDRLPRLYTQLADWWPLLSSPDEYAAEAELYRRTLLEACSRRPETILELGSVVATTPRT